LSDSRAIIGPGRPLRRLLPVHRRRTTQRHANAQKNRPESPPWILRSHLPLRLSRPLATDDLPLAPRHLHETLPCLSKTSIVSDVPLDKSAAPLLNAVAPFSLVNRFKSTTMRAILCISDVSHMRRTQEAQQRKRLQQWRTP
jgi:hypothetical protein